MAGYSGYDSRLVWGGTAVGQVRDVRGPGMAQEPINTTTRDDGEIDTFAGGLRNGGEATFDVVYDPQDATQTVLRTAYETGAFAMIELQTTETGTQRPSGLRFFGTVTGFEPRAPMRDVLTADVTVQVSGAAAGIDYLVDHAGNFLVDHSGRYLIA